MKAECVSRIDFVANDGVSKSNSVGNTTSGEMGGGAPQGRIILTTQRG